MANEFLTVQQAQYLLSKNAVTVDDTLSTSSENPVQNKVITNALNAIQNDPVDVTDSVSVANNSTTNLCQSAQYDAGIYLVSAYVTFGASDSGRRMFRLSSSSGGSAVNNWSQEILAAASNTQPTHAQMTTIQKRTSTGRWYLVVYQNSGGALTVGGGIRVLKLH